MENLRHKHREGVTVGYRDNQLVTIDSREVAEMMGKEHSEILNYIEGRVDKNGNALVVGIIPTLETEGLQYQKYFIPSTYRAGTREYKCYLVTKMGCELLGNKQQGEKGILFSAKYVERFNQMEQAIKGQALNTSKLSKELQAILMIDNKTLELEKKLEKTNNKFDELPLFMSDSKALKKIANRVVVELLGGKQAPAYEPMSKKVFSDLYRQVHREFQISAVEEIKRKDLELAKEIISEYRLPIALKNEVELLNNQINLNI